MPAQEYRAATAYQNDLLDLGEALAKVRDKAQALANQAEDGGEGEARIAPLLQTLVEVVKSAQAVKAIALGEVDAWVES